MGESLHGADATEKKGCSSRSRCDGTLPSGMDRQEESEGQRPRRHRVVGEDIDPLAGGSLMDGAF